MNLLAFLLFFSLGIRAEEETDSAEEDFQILCELCTDHVPSLIGLATKQLRSHEPYKESTKECETCLLTNIENTTVRGLVCVTKEEGCDVETIPMKLPTAIMNCDCEFKSKNGKKKGNLTAVVENANYSLISKSCNETFGDLIFHEDGHVSAENIKLTCRGDDDFKKACEEEEYIFDIDEAVRIVGRRIVKYFQNFIEYKEFLKEFDCREYIYNNRRREV